MPPPLFCCFSVINAVGHETNVRHILNKHCTIEKAQGGIISVLVTGERTSGNKAEKMKITRVFETCLFVLASCVCQPFVLVL